MEPQGQRREWDAVPDHVRDEVAARLGSPVVSAVNQPGGFSPGVAARCRLADGRRCFVKALSSDPNPASPEMHRREAHIAACLPPTLPVPALLATYDDGEWVVLVFEDVDGRPPRVPWTLDELAATFAALDRLAADATPCPVEGLPTFAERHVEMFGGFRRLASGDATVDRLDEWTRRHLDRLAALEADWDNGVHGDTLLHSDLRADNLLVRDDGSVVVVDWPHACVGAAWIDRALMLPSVGLQGGPSPVDVEDALRPFDGLDPAAVDRVIVGLAGYFAYEGNQPDPPGLPTVRAFQRAQGELTNAWLAARLGLP